MFKDGMNNFKFKALYKIDNKMYQVEAIRFTPDVGFFVFFFGDKRGIEHDENEVTLYKATGRKNKKGVEIYRKY